MAAALAEAGARVALVGRDVEQLNATHATIQAAGGVSGVFPSDISDESNVIALERAVSAEFGRVDILINNAGINIRRPLLEFTLDEWNQVMTVNSTAAFLMCRAFVPHMKGRGYGRVINVASTMSHVSRAQRSAYSASKAALLGMTRALALELAPEQITVVAISPGPFATEINSVLLADPAQTQFFLGKVALGRWGRVEEIGGLAVFLCTDAASYITGTDILIDGGWCAQ